MFVEWRQYAEVDDQDARHQLPMDIGEFTGRTAELDRLVAMTGGGAPLVVTVEGMAGVGKTRFAVHAAHALTRAGRYDEFQLWSDLHGFDHDQRIADPADVLERFLRLLGVPGARIPRDVDERAALYRDRLAGRRGLVLLDNASSEDQVRPLLPGDPGSLVLITSRHRLSRLDGAQRLPLEVFRPDEAVALLATIAGQVRVRAEPDQAERVAGLAGHLPLLIALAARRLAARPAWRLADLADLLEARGHAGVEHGVDRSVGASFDLSYRGLPGAEQRMFRLLGLHPGADFTAGAAAALAGTTVAAAEAVLEQLLDEHLLQQEVAGRYRFHDLLRDYVREVALADEPTPRREAARRRCLAWYLDAADSAVQVLEPHRRRAFRLNTADVAALRPEFGSDAAALAWCDTERANLVAAVHAAAGTEIAWQLPAVLLRFFYRRSHWADWLDTHRVALDSVRGSGDRRAEATVLNGLGVAYGDLRQFAESVEHVSRAAELFAAAGDAWGQAWCLNNVGVTCINRGEPSDAAAAVDRLRHGLELFRQVGDPQGIATCLNNLGDAYRLLYRPADAIDCLHEAIELQATTDRTGQRYSHGTLGDVYRDSGEHQSAIEHYRLALAAHREVGDRRGAGRVLHSLGETLAATGQLDAARRHLREALAILDELGDPEAASIELPAPELDQRQRELVRRIQAFADSRLGDPELSPGGIAAAHHISLRYLYKLFQAEETTVSAWIRTRRLERCRDDLVDPDLAGRPISATATRWGFASPAHFSRAFRAEYGVTPGEYRRERSVR